MDQKNWDDWELICGLTGTEISTLKLKKILESLMEESLYQIAYVAITACSKKYLINKAIEKTMFSKMIENWEDDTMMNLVKQIGKEMKKLEEVEAAG